MNPSLRALDQTSQSYLEGKISISDYLLSLEKYEGAPFCLALETFRAARRLEQTLNFSRVETERTNLLDALLRKLNPAEQAALLSLAVQTRAGSVGQADFYETVKGLCSQKGLSLAAFP